MDSNRLSIAIFFSFFGTDLKIGLLRTPENLSSSDVKFFFDDDGIEGDCLDTTVPSDLFLTDLFFFPIVSN